MLTIAVVGAKSSGKTTTIEALTRSLTKSGFTVAAIKHIHETDFTIDSENKDTWRYAHAGAHLVMSVAPKEVAKIRKVDTTKQNLGEIIRECVNEADVVFLEGFKELVRNNPVVPKIVAVKTAEEAMEASKRYQPILAFSGPAPTSGNTLGIPHVDVMVQPETLANLVGEKVKISLETKNEPEGRIMIQVEGQPLPLNSFVQNILRNTVLAMISALRDTKITGNENVLITIQNGSKESLLPTNKKK